MSTDSSSIPPASVANLDPRGPRVGTQDTSAFRQVHPNHVHEGRLTRVAFEVKGSDGGLLSISLSTKTTPEAAFNHFTQKLGRKSCGVYAVTIGECDAAALPVWEDPEDQPVPDPAHGVIDFRQHIADKKAKKLAEAQLARLAEARGPIYRPA